MAARKTPSSGSKPDKLWRDAIMRAVNRRAEGDGGKQLDRLADRLVKEALAGDVSALKEIGDRIDGKPSQVIAGDKENPLALQIVGVAERLRAKLTKLSSS